jgi:diguanylate cyclase (GGDEF)-like protein
LSIGLPRQSRNHAVTAASTALAILLLQQGLFTALWLIMALVHLSRRTAVHWALSTAAVAGGMALVLSQERLQPVLGFWAANLLFVGSFVLLRRGIEIFASTPPQDREHALMPLLVLLLMVIDGASPASWPSVAAMSLLMAYLLARAAWVVHTRLRAEFGARVAATSAVPLWVVATLLGVRGLLGPFLPSIMSPSMAGSGAGNVSMLVAFVGCGILLMLAQVSLVIIRLVTRLQHLSDHDALTGVLNRRSIERALAAEAARLSRQGRTYAVLALDIDHFKGINDRFGHPAGDAVLRELGLAMRQAGRDSDLVARTGGEEFWMLMPATDLRGALPVAQRLLGLVRELRVKVPQAEIRFTVSIGVAVADQPGEKPDDLIRRLDAALYRAKHLGRDRVELAGGPVQRAPVSA